MQYIKYLLLLSGLLAYYGGAGQLAPVFAAISLLLIFFINRVSMFNLIFFAFLIIFWSLKLIVGEQELIVAIYDLKFFWGFSLFFLFFYSESKDVGIGLKNLKYCKFFKGFLSFAIIGAFIEFITSNLFMISLPNRQHHFYEEAREGLARAYGFGGNATVTISLCVSLFAIYYKNIKRDLLLLIPVTSSTGFFLILFKKFITSKARKKLSVFVFIILVFTLFIFLAELLNTYISSISKISFEYFSIVFNVKMAQIERVIDNAGVLEFLLGYDYGDFSTTTRTGDFQMLDFISRNGLIGSFLFFYLIIKKVNSVNKVAIIIIVLGTMHYHVIFSIPGQIIFGFLLGYLGNKKALK